ncbi:MAG: helix-turn-helix domain-containing protein [Burkholderiaceae bacterium]
MPEEAAKSHQSTRPTTIRRYQAMLLMLPPPNDLRHWIQAGVILHGASDLRCTQFPAILESLLVVRVSGDVLPNADDTASLPQSALILPTTKFSSYAHAGAVHAVGLVLQPEVTSCLLRGSVEGLANSHLCLTDLFGDRFNLSVQEILDSEDDHTRIGILFEYFRRHLLTRRNESQRERLHGIRRTMTGDLGEACRIMRIGSRQLQRRCLAGYGVTPKQYQTITRLQNTLKMALLSAPRRQGSGIDFALENGFFDQSHMARDLRRMAGISLRELPDRSSISGTPFWPLTVGTALP